MERCIWKATAILFAAAVMLAGCSLSKEQTPPPTAASQSEAPKPKTDDKFAALNSEAIAIAARLDDPAGPKAPALREHLDALKAAIQTAMPESKSEADEDLVTLFIAAHMRGEEAAKAVDGKTAAADAAVASARKAIAAATTAYQGRR